MGDIIDRLKKLEADVVLIKEALIGRDPILHPGEGLINVHQTCFNKVKDIDNRVTRLERDVNSLVNYRRDIKAYAAGAMLVVTVLWELITHYIKPL